MNPMANSNMKTLSVQQQIDHLEPLVQKLIKAHTIHEKLDVVNENPNVHEYLSQSNLLAAYMQGINPDCDFAIRSILAIGQGPIVFRGIEGLEEPYEVLRGLLRLLLEIEQFYQVLGGIAGYHLTVLKLIIEKTVKCGERTDKENYIKPEGLDVSKNSEDLQRYLRFGLEHLHELAVIFPVGGAGDRLGLKDDKTDKPLPAAMLNFCGHTLWKVFSETYRHWSSSITS